MTRRKRLNLRRYTMRKIIFILIAVFIFGFSSCDLKPKEESDPWFFPAVFEVAYMFGYKLYDDSNTAGNKFVGENERTGVCLDYAIHFALKTNSLVIVSTGVENPGIYKVIQEVSVPLSSRRWFSYNDEMIAIAYDKTEAWYLEKVGEYYSGLKVDLTGDEHLEHAWNLTKDDYVVDVTAFDWCGYYSVLYRKLGTNGHDRW